MGILDGLTPVTQLEPCKVGRIIIELEPGDAKVMVDAMQDERWTPTGLANALTARGIQVTPDTLRSHMKRTCRCSRI